MPQWPVAAQNAILVAGLPLFFEYEASGNIYPGYVVNLDRFPGVDWEIEACDADAVNVIGVADLAMSSQTGRGSWRKYDCDNESDVAARNLPYIDGDQVKVISGPIIVMLVLCASQTIVAGDKLQCCGGTTPGMVAEFTCLSAASPCSLIAEAMEDVTTAAGHCAYVMAKLLI